MKTLKDMLSHDRFAAETGVELLEVREGYAKARMLVTDKHLNGGGVCQGGALFTLADLAFAAVANSRNLLTLSLNANITDMYMPRLWRHSIMPRYLSSKFVLPMRKVVRLLYSQVPATGKRLN